MDALDKLYRDQAQEWDKGERKLVEAYLAERPDLANDLDAVAALVQGELMLRKDRHESFDEDDYLARLPQHRDVVHMAFAMHRALELDEVPGNSGGDPAPPTAGHGTPTVPGYEILGELGRGGMGVVYKALHVSLHRVVALKMILAGEHAPEAYLARFRTEAAAIARLQHPNIVQIHDVGEHGGLPFLSLEYCPGGGLDKKLAGTPQPPRDAAVLVEKLARAMDAAHGRGVIHRDLKPANVLLSLSRDPEGSAPPALPSGSRLNEAVPKITDFGLAKKLGEMGQTASGAIMGTPSYMAPEQANGNTAAIGPLTDVYALGAILYECLTGRPPFRADTVAKTLRQVVEEEPVAPRLLNPGVPRDLETICLKCLRKEAAQRYASAADLADDLKRFLDGEPIWAHPVGAGERLWKWMKRYPARASLIAVLVGGSFVAAGFVGALAVGYGEYTRVQKARQEAEDAREKEQVLRGQVALLLEEQQNLNYGLTIPEVLRARKQDDPFRAIQLLDGCPLYFARFPHTRTPKTAEKMRGPSNNGPFGGFGKPAQKAANP